MSTLGAAQYPPAVPAAQTGRRPDDLRARIIQAAAETFSAQGYHAASVEAIAAQAGIAVDVLFQHYPSVYDMFAAAVLDLSQQLVDCLSFVDATSDDDLAAKPTAMLGRVVDALIEVTLGNRKFGGLYRWQAHYLRPADLAVLVDQVRLTNHRIQRPLRVLRPTLTTAQRWMLSSGLCSAVGSILDHRTRLPGDEMRRLLAEAGTAILSAPLPEPGDGIGNPAAVRRIFAPDVGADEAVLQAALTLFGSQGYEQTNMAQIAEAAGIPVAGIYRHFPGKYPILVSGLQRVAGRIVDELSPPAGTGTEPDAELTRLIDAYLARAFANPELISIFYTEVGSLTPEDRDFLDNVQRSAISTWVELLTLVRPELNASQARILVQAALPLVVDVSRFAGRGRPIRDGQLDDLSAHLLAGVRQLMECILFGGAEGSADLVVAQRKP